MGLTRYEIALHKPAPVDLPMHFRDLTHEECNAMEHVLGSRWYDYRNKDLPLNDFIPAMTKEAEIQHRKQERIASPAVEMRFTTEDMTISLADFERLSTATPASTLVQMEDARLRAEMEQHMMDPRSHGYSAVIRG